jgi:CRISPR-associated protein Cas1
MKSNELINEGNPARLLIKVTRDTLPQVKEKYPFLYLEKGRMEIDDSSVKWIDCDCNVVRLPVAMLNCILLGPGTTVTHEAVKVMAAANCGICWVGDDSMMFFASGQTPTSNTRNMHHQMMLAATPAKSLEVARRMFAYRFPDADLEKKTLPQMMGMEGLRVRKFYEEMAVKYKVGWKGRRFEPGKFEMSDTTNKILTAANAALYSIIMSAVHSMLFAAHRVHSRGQSAAVHLRPGRSVQTARLHRAGFFADRRNGRVLRPVQDRHGVPAAGDRNRPARQNRAGY